MCVRMDRNDDKYKIGMYIKTAISRVHFQIHAVDLCAWISFPRDVKVILEIDFFDNKALFL